MTETERVLAILDGVVASLCTAALGEQYQVPTDLDRVARYLGVRVAPSGDSRLAVDGRLSLRGQEAVVDYRSGMSLTRQRFTIAHELGHALLLHPRRAIHIPIRAFGGEERFCNQFAAALLFPRHWLETFAAERPTLRVLFDAARSAESSAQALSRSLFTYGFWDTGLLSLRKHQEAWSVENWAAVAPYKLADVDVSPRSAKRLKELAAGIVPPLLRLELMSGQRRLEVEGEAQVDPMNCLMLATPPIGL